MNKPNNIKRDANKNKFSSSYKYEASGRSLRGSEDLANTNITTWIMPLGER